MKKIIGILMIMTIGIALLMVPEKTSGQAIINGLNQATCSALSTAGTDYDTITNTATGYITFPTTKGLNSLWKYAILCECDERSGTGSVYAFLQGSVDDTTWTTLALSADTLSADGGLYFEEKTGTPWKYLRVGFTGIGTTVFWVDAKLFLKP